MKRYKISTLSKSKVKQCFIKYINCKYRVYATNTQFKINIYHINQLKL